MTLGLAVAQPPELAVQPSGYQPAVCNIGPAEIARRRRAGHIGVLLTLVTFAVLVALNAPPLARFIVALPAAVAATGYLQAWLKFCVAFASVGVFNFGSVGRTVRIDDPAARARDRARARRVTSAAALIGAAFGLAAVLLPI